MMQRDHPCGHPVATTLCVVTLVSGLLLTVMHDGQVGDRMESATQQWVGYLASPMATDHGRVRCWSMGGQMLDDICGGIM